jgi:hypothetical protein
LNTCAFGSIGDHGFQNIVITSKATPVLASIARSRKPDVLQMGHVTTLIERWGWKVRTDVQYGRTSCSSPGEGCPLGDTPRASRAGQEEPWREARSGPPGGRDHKPSRRPQGGSGIASRPLLGSKDSHQLCRGSEATAGAFSDGSAPKSRSSSAKAGSALLRDRVGLCPPLRVSPKSKDLRHG